MRPFVHLHNHTTYSVRDGLQKLGTMVEAAVADRQPAIATTDHGSLAATWKMERICRDRGTKYVPGAELYLAFGDRREREGREEPEISATGAIDSTSKKVRKYQHLTVLAASEEGWRNLLLISHHAHDPDAFWSKPRADMDLLARHAAGLVVLTGCIGGPLAAPLVHGDHEEASTNLSKLVDVFGRDRVFVEVMDHGIEAERRILGDLVGLSKRFGLRVAATNDSHYTRPYEHEAHDALLCLADEGKTLSSPDRWRFSGTGYHLRTAAEMHEIFDDQPGTELACDTTLDIAEMVEDRVIPAPRMRLPRFPLPEHKTAERQLFELAKAGAKRLYGDPYPEEVRERLRYEYKVVTDKQFADYFLVLEDVVRWAKSRGIRVGPGRGSAGGSILAYCLGITTIDPIRYHLLFERFLSPDRVGMPDIDTDFEQGRREEVFGYLTEKYGHQHTAHIGTVTLQLTNAALRNAGRVLDRPELGARLAAKVPHGAGGKPLPLALLEDPGCEPGAELRASTEGDPNAASVVAIARAFEGNVTAEGIHACGFLVSDEPLPGLVPLRRDRRPGHDGRGLVTEWDGTDCEAAGMLKLDVLGIRNLDVISATEKIVYERTGERVDAETASDDPDDPDPLARARARAGWQLIAEGRTAGVFQLESAGMTELAQKVAPTSIEELSAIVALFRPGPLGARTHEHYANRRGGREPVDYGIFTDDPAETEVIAGLLGDTYGLMIYQEQMMRVAQGVAGFDAIGRDRLRKAIGKKLPAEMAAVGAAFIEGAVADHDVEGRPKLAFKRTTAEALWHGMENAAAYAFNACLTGDTVLQTGSQTTWTIAELYRKLTTIDTSGPTCGWCNKQLSVGQYVVRGLCKGCYAWHRKFHGSIGLTLLAYDFTDGRLRPARVKDVHLSGIQPVWKITLADGRTVTATANHRFMAADGWRQVRHLSVGDALVVDGGYEKQQYDPSYRTTRGKRNPTGHGKPWKYGKENCGYVDGGFIAFQEWTRSTRDNATCAVCGKVDGRLERAHLDGNRANNDPSNLRWLCVSHHKQHDYRVNGRRHRWDKGHVADKSEIVSIEPAGLAQTYDVEMDDEGHNFTANGIVSHNSHSVGYAKLAWETAWLKANWPAAFGAGLLSVTGADDRRTSILRSLAADGIAVSTPDVNLGDVHTTLGADGVVRLGIGEIKGMRHDDAVAIVAERSRAGAFSTFADFLARVRLSTGSVRALVEAGACDGFGPRSGLVRAMRVAGVSDVATPDTEWSVVERAARERERLGVTLSSNPLKVLTDQLRQWRSPHTQHAPVPLHRIGERCRNGEIVSTIGVVASFEIVKKGRRRAKLVLEGSAGSMDCIVWSDQLQAIEHEGSVPVAGAVVGVDARVRQTTIPLPADLDEHADEPDEETDAAAPGLTTKTELEIRYIWTASLDDRPRLLRDAKSQVNGKIGADRKAGAQEFT